MTIQYRTIQGEDAYQANLRMHCCPAPAKRKAVSAVLSKQGHRQGHDPSGGLALLILANIAAALARTNLQ
jgi:hypothetical protein